MFGLWHEVSPTVSMVEPLWSHGIMVLCVTPCHHVGYYVLHYVIMWGDMCHPMSSCGMLCYIMSSCGGDMCYTMSSCGMLCFTLCHRVG